MTQYRLSVGSILSSPEDAIGYGDPPIHIVSFRHLSDVLSRPDEVRHGVKALFGLAPLTLGLTLKEFQYRHLEDAICVSASSRVEPLTVLAYSNFGFDTDVLMLEVIRPFYGVVDGETRYYKHMSDVYNSKRFGEYKSAISYKTLTRKFKACNSFEVRNENPHEPRLECFKYQGVVYQEQEQIR